MTASQKTGHGEFWCKTRVVVLSVRSRISAVFSWFAVAPSLALARIARAGGGPVRARERHAAANVLLLKFDPAQRRPQG